MCIIRVYDGVTVLGLLCESETGALSVTFGPNES